MSRQITSNPQHVSILRVVLSLEGNVEEPPNLTNIQTNTALDVGNLSRMLGKLTNKKFITKKKESRFTVFKIYWPGWIEYFEEFLKNKLDKVLEVKIIDEAAQKQSEIILSLLAELNYNDEEVIHTVNTAFKAAVSEQDSDITINEFMERLYLFYVSLAFKEDVVPRKDISDTGKILATLSGMIYALPLYTYNTQSDVRVAKSLQKVYSK